MQAKDQDRLVAEEFLRKVRHTRPSRILGLARILLGLVLTASGALKFSVPRLWEVWSAQLVQADIPIYSFNLWFVPIAELVAGTLLIMGVHARLNALLAIGMMVVAVYVHLVVSDPSLFPLQPQEPVVPGAILIMAIYVLWGGAGRWSIDRLSRQE